MQLHRYELKHRYTTITYGATVYDGQPHLSYQVANGPATFTFSRDKIHVQESKIGTLVTVTVEAVSDERVTLLTLLMPAINLVGTTELDVETVGIMTTQRSSIACPGFVNGAVQNYHTRKLEGKVRFVVP